MYQLNWSTKKDEDITSEEEYIQATGIGVGGIFGNPPPERKFFENSPWKIVKYFII